MTRISSVPNSLASPDDLLQGLSADEAVCSLETSAPTMREGSALWQLPSLIDGTEPDYPKRLVYQLESLLGCAVWLSCHSRHGKLQHEFISPTANQLALPSHELRCIAIDAAESSNPIGANCPEELPASPSAIMEDAWAKHPGITSMSLPVSEVDARHRWVCTLAWQDRDGYAAALRITAWMELNAPTIGRALVAWKLHQEGTRWDERRTALIGLFKKPSRWIAVGVTLGAAMLCLPVPYRPTRDCIVEPSIRQYVASPIEGRLKSILVRPGDEVRTGQLIAKLDDAQIRRDLASAEAELQTFSKKRDIAMASRAEGDRRIAQLECQQAQLKIESLTDQLNRLEIHSPGTGIVVQGDWFGNEGMPVTFGQSLFEIAPLDKMIAEVHLAADDLPWVRVGTPAVLRTDASLIQSWSGTIERMEPHAVVIDDQAVFIGEMEIDNDARLFRPGMQAKVVVNAGNKTLAWLLFRKPYQWLQNQWIW